jgi:hypothetical protein
MAKLTDAARIAMLQKPSGWTEAQHIEAAEEHGDLAKALRDKAKRPLKRNATVEEEKKHHVKREQLEADAAFHREVSEKHILWSRTAFREMGEYEQYFKGKV